jgi:DNA-binding NtrC family response regulator
MNIGLGNRRRTILLIDNDPHARKILRLALEAASFSVGEACNAHEGERTATRIQPDAILTDVIMDPTDRGMTLPERLHAGGSHIPCYIVSSASEALVGAVGLHELGVAGVFLKPVDAAIIVETLKCRLGLRMTDDAHA